VLWIVILSGRKYLEKISENHYCPMKRYFLETSVIINFLRGKSKTIQAIENLVDELVSSFVCLAELYEEIYWVREKK